MKFKRHHLYRPIESAWLHEIPNHWKFMPSWPHFRVIEDRAGDRSDDLELLSVSQSRGVVPRHAISDKEPRADDLSIYRHCRAGDVIINRMSAYQGAVGVSPQDGMVSPDYLVLRCADSLHPKFLVHLLKSSGIIGEIVLRLRGIGSPGAGTVRTPRIGASDLGRIIIPLPPVEEQSSAVKALDHETARIDELITKQERLIELLAEKRQAVITRAVTKGLDPDAPTKPSGIPWLGDIHASWPVRPLKAAGHINLGKMIQPTPKTDADFEAPYLRAANVQPNGVLALDDVKKMWFNDSELRSLDVRSGDVVVVEGGIGGFGRAAYVDKDLPGFAYQNSINRIRPPDSVDGRFLTYLLLAARHAGYIHAYCTGVSMPHLTAEKLAAISVPVPDLATQTQISDHIDARLSKINALSDKASAVITILNERRSALISAAVTGKINVRSQ